LIYGLVILILVLAAYLECLGGTFVWDDRPLILGSPLVERVASLSDYLRNPFWNGLGGRPVSTGYYRPLVTASFALDQRLHAGNAAGFHLTNLAFHALNALLLYAVIRRTGTRAATCALVAACWALLPRLAEVAAWISGRTDAIATAAVLAALLAWGPSFRRRLASALLLGVGMFAKESTLAGVVAVAALEVSAVDDPRRRLRSILVSVVPLLAASALYLVARVRAVGMHAVGESLGWKRGLVVLEALGTYTLMLLDPLRPRAAIGRVGVVTPLGLAAGVMTLVGVALFVWWRGRRLRGWQACGLLLAVFGLLPVVQLVPIPVRTLAADRFLYLPAAGLAIALGSALDRLLGARRVSWAAACAVLAVLFVAANRRAAVWSDEVTFWVTTYNETPSYNSAPATEFTGVYYRAGLYEDALMLTERALRYDDPGGRGKAGYNAALCLGRLGRREEALARLANGAGGDRVRGELELQMAILEIQLGRIESARARLTSLANGGISGARTLLEHLPEFEEALRRLATAGEQDFEARAELETVLGDAERAGPDWVRAARLPGVSKATIVSALRFLVQTGDRAGIAEVARIHGARFGPIEPELDAIVSLRLAELERLIAERPAIRPAPARVTAFDLGRHASP
jgi:tetratricopeptide (TPR) repeat protein